MLVLMDKLISLWCVRCCEMLFYTPSVEEILEHSIAELSPIIRDEFLSRKENMSALLVALGRLNPFREFIC